MKSRKTALMYVGALGLFVALFSLVLVVLSSLNYIVRFKDPKFTYRPDHTLYDAKLFTGMSYQLHGKSWRLYKLQFFSEGKQQLTEHRWFSNGKKWQEIGFKDGKKHGKHLAWYKSGHVHYIKNFVLDLPEGEFWAWHDNGKVSQYHFFKMGEQVIYKSFIGDGKPFYNYVYRGNEREGLQGGNFCRTRKR